MINRLMNVTVRVTRPVSYEKVRLFGFLLNRQTLNETGFLTLTLTL